MINDKKEFNRAIEILMNPGIIRSYEDLDFLSNYLLFLEDFRKYITRMNKVMKLQLCRALKLQKYERKEDIFNKGDPSNQYFIIMKGYVDIYDIDTTGKLLYLTQIEAGKQIGERGIIRGTARACSVIAGEQTVYLITLTAQEFKQMIGNFVFELLEEKMNFVRKYIPSINSYSNSYKEKIAYALNIETYKRGDVIIEKDSFCDILYYVYEGECSISVPHGMRFRNIVKIGVGNCFGEECVLFGLKSCWKINVSSEFCLIAEISRADLFLIFPHDIIEAIKHIYQLKNQSRSLWIHAASKYIPDFESPITKNSSFPRASKYARKRLVEHIERSKPRIINTNRYSSNSKIALRRKLNRLKEGVRNPKPLSESPTRLKEDMYSFRSNHLKLKSESSQKLIGRSFTPKPSSGQDSESNLSFLSSNDISNPKVRSFTPSFLSINDISSPKIRSFTPRLYRIGRLNSD